MVAILRLADRDPIGAVAKRHGISEQTIYTWRKRFGALQSDASVNLLFRIFPSDSCPILAAHGYSCRHQIRDGSGREPRHVAFVLAEAMRAGGLGREEPRA